MTEHSPIKRDRQPFSSEGGQQHDMSLPEAVAELTQLLFQGCFNSQWNERTAVGKVSYVLSVPLRAVGFLGIICIGIWFALLGVTQAAAARPDVVLKLIGEKYRNLAFRGDSSE